MLLQFHCFSVECCRYPRSVRSVHASRVILFIIGLRNVVAVSVHQLVYCRAWKLARAACSTPAKQRDVAVAEPLLRAASPLTTVRRIEVD